MNFAHYDPARVTKLYALEPNRRMIQLADLQKSRTELALEFFDLPGERIPLQDGVVDTVVSTFTLCTIEGTAEAIRGIRQVLRPGGRLIFIEIGLSPDASVRRWQERWEPIHRRVFEGLRLTKDIPALIQDGGFTLERTDAGYQAEAIPYESQAFDKVFTVHTVYFWPGLRRPLQEIARVLKPGGRLVLAHRTDAAARRDFPASVYRFPSAAEVKGAPSRRKAWSSTTPSFETWVGPRWPSTSPAAESVRPPPGRPFPPAGAAAAAREPARGT